MELISGWKTWPKQFSTWLVAAGAAVIAMTPELVTVWQQLPVELQSAVPQEWLKWIGVALVALSVPAKLVRQSSLYRQAQQDELTRDL